MPKVPARTVTSGGGRGLLMLSNGHGLPPQAKAPPRPKNHGGTDDLENLAIACASCNSEKGLRHDHKRADDPKLQEVIARLQRRRRERFRS